MSRKIDILGIAKRLCQCCVISVPNASFCCVDEQNSIPPNEGSVVNQEKWFCGRGRHLSFGSAIFNGRDQKEREKKPTGLNHELHSRINQKVQLICTFRIVLYPLMYY